METSSLDFCCRMEKKQKELEVAGSAVQDSQQPQHVGHHCVHVHVQGGGQNRSGAPVALLSGSKAGRYEVLVLRFLSRDV